MEIIHDDLGIMIKRYVGDPLKENEERVNVIHLNTHYRFHGVWVNPSDVLGHCKDPNYTVFSAELSVIIEWFQFFELKDLRLLSKAHGIHPGRSNKAMLLDGLRHHECISRCKNLIYIFKCMPQARRNTLHKFDVLPEDHANHVARPHVGTLVTGTHQNPELGGPDDSEIFEQSEDNADYLEIVDIDRKMSIIQEWQDAMSMENLAPVVCAACSLRVSRKKSLWVKASDIDLSPLRNPRLPASILPTSYDLRIYKAAILNPKGLEFTDQLGHMRLCIPCNHSLSMSTTPKFALSNWFYYGQDALPSNVQKAFSEATIFDKMLICRARSNTVTCRFNSGNSSASGGSADLLLKQARKGIRGNVLVAPLDSVKINEIIPPSTDVIKDTMCAVFIGNTLPTRATLARYKPILVRKSRVKTMITFLLQHNQHYQPSSTFRYSEENLNNLFDDSEGERIPSAVHIGYIPLNEAMESTVADYTSRNVDESGPNHDYDDLLMENVGFTDGDNSPMAYSSMKTLALEHCLGSKPFIAAGTGSDIVREFGNPSILTWLFPHLDPWGIGGFNHPDRNPRVSMEEQLRHLLMIDNSPFERDPEFAFVFYNICRKKLVYETLKYSIPVGTHRRLVDQLLAIDPQVLHNLAEACERDPYYKPAEGDEKSAFRLLSSVRLVSRHVPGSDGYKIMMRNEIRAIMNNKGAPTLFITLNPSDVDHPIVRLLAGEDIDLECISRGEDLSKWRRSLLAAKNPSACARFFDLMIRQFIDTILGFGKSEGGLYGKCVSYYGTVEAQGKGTLHCHMLVWLQGHLSPEKLREKMVLSVEYQRKILRWIESVIQCEFPNSEGIEHQKRCHPRRILNPENGDPHPGVVPLPQLSDYVGNKAGFMVVFDHFVERLLHHYGWHEHQATCWKHLERGQDKTDENCRMRMNGETVEVSVLDENTHEIILRRHHPKIAAHTPLVTFLMQCNMDAKHIGSGEKAKCLVHYSTDYITKPSLAVHAGMAALSYAVTKTRPKLPDNVKDITEAQATGAIVTAVNSMMGRQEISHPQVMSYLVGGGDHYTPEQFAILKWGLIKRCLTGPTDSEVDPESHVIARVSLTLGRGSITISNQYLDYSLRPVELRFEGLCLYDFVACVGKYKRPGGKCNQRLPGCFLNDLHPQFETHYLTIRREKYIPVILGPSIPNPNKSTEAAEEWARDVLILFKPWRDLDGLKQGFETWLESYNDYEPRLMASHKRVIGNFRVLSECSDARDRDRSKRHGKASNDIIRDEVMDEEPESSVKRSDPGACDELMQEHEDAIWLDNVTTKRDDIISGNVLDLLNLCLPIQEVNTLAEQGGQAPERITDENMPLIAEHESNMQSKKKRKRGDAAESYRSDATDNRDDELAGEPIAARIVLPERDLFQYRIDHERAVAESVILDMGLSSNPEQLRAFTKISNHLILRNRDQLLMHVAGVGGTGKSHLIKAVVTLFERLGKRNNLVLGAPTGIAATLINGQTLHSLILSTPGTRRVNVEGLILIWKNVSYLIIDEVSMVGARFLSQLSSRMRQGKGDDPLAREKPFGGVNVIFMGDFGQLKPPKQYALYAYELIQNPSFPEARSERGISALNGAFLWRQINSAVELVKNQRHANDEKYAKFLDRLRVGKCETTTTTEGLSDLAYISTRLMENQASNKEVMEEFCDAPIIVGSKVLRDLLNSILIKYHARKRGVAVHPYFSHDVIDKKPATGRIQKHLWNISSTVNHDSFGVLALFIGMKVMVTDNLAFDSGIVNGREGIVTNIVYEEDELARRYAKVVYVYIEGCGIALSGLERDVVPIFPTTTQVEHGLFNVQGIRTKSCSRRQIPLVPAYVYTDFKGQGRTLRRAIVDIATARGQGVYVMLSRVTSLSGLLILRWFPPNKIYQRLPEDLRSELHRIHQLSNVR